MAHLRTAATSIVSISAALAATQGADAQQWDGFHAGVTAGLNFGTFPWTNSDPDYDYRFDDEAAFGAFVGYDFTTNSGMRLGVEAAFSQGFAMESVGTSHPSDTEDYNVVFLVDTRLRIGLDMLELDNTNVYAFAGPTGGIMEYNQRNYGIWGVNAGIGAEYFVTDQISVGGEIFGRVLHGYTNYSNAGPSGGAALRAAFHW